VLHGLCAMWRLVRCTTRFAFSSSIGPASGQWQGISGPSPTPAGVRVLPVVCTRRSNDWCWPLSEVPNVRLSSARQAAPGRFAMFVKVSHRTMSSRSLDTQGRAVRHYPPARYRDRLFAAKVRVWNSLLGSGKAASETIIARLEGIDNPDVRA
jgi:hypothetical protein